MVTARHTRARRAACARISGSRDLLRWQSQLLAGIPRSRVVDRGIGGGQLLGCIFQCGILRIAGERLRGGDNGLGRDNLSRLRGRGGSRDRRPRCDHRPRGGLRGFNDRLRRLLRRPHHECGELRGVRSRLSRGSGMPKERVRLPAGREHLRRPMRGHRVGREKLRSLRQGMPGGDGVLARRLRVGMRGTADRVRGLLRRHVGERAQLRQLRSCMRRRPVVLDGGLPVSDRTRRVRGQRAMCRRDDERPSLRNVQQRLRHGRRLYVERVFVSGGANGVQRRVCEPQHGSEELRRVRHGVHDGRHSVPRRCVYQSDQRPLRGRRDVRL